MENGIHPPNLLSLGIGDKLPFLGASHNEDAGSTKGRHGRCVQQWEHASDHRRFSVRIVLGDAFLMKHKEEALLPAPPSLSNLCKVASGIIWNVIHGSLDGSLPFGGLGLILGT